MPNPIDRCGACQQPVYVEENVAGGCGCPDRDFRVLLAQQRHRNNTGNEDFASSFVASPPPALTELDPSFLMSAAGRNEFEAARQLAGPSFRSTLAQGLRGRTEHVAFLDDAADFGPTARTMADTNPNVSSPRQAQPVPPVEDEIDLDSGDEWTGQWEDHGRHNARVASTAAQMDSVDLSAMWLQGTGIPFDRSQLVTPDHLDDFQFDTGELAVDTTNYPRGGGVGGGRFRVDQAPPVRPAFNRSRVDDGGVEIGRVGRGGRFEGRPLPPPPPPQPNIFEQVRADFAAPPPPRPEPRQAPVSAVQQARALQAKPRGPSVYDLIRSNPLKGK